MNYGFKVEGHGNKYSISNCGSVRNDPTGRVLKPWINKHTGYKQVALGTPKKRYTIHNLVATYYCDKEDQHEQVNHIDGDKLNNDYTNLEWCTRSHNIQHAYDTGLNQGSRVVDDTSVKAMLEFGYTQRHIAKHFNVVESCIVEAKKRLGIMVSKTRKLTIDEKSEAIEAVLAGVSHKNIANEYGCDGSTVSRLMTAYRQADGVL